MDKKTCRERLKEMNCLVVIPTYNNFRSTSTAL